MCQSPKSSEKDKAGNGALQQKLLANRIKLRMID
jgi:hypothetical protein